MSGAAPSTAAAPAAAAAASSSTVREKVKSMFPSNRDAIPAPARMDSKEVEFATNVYLVDGQIKQWNGATIHVKSPVFIDNKPVILGAAPQLDPKEAMVLVHAAHKAYNYGTGEWPKASVATRIEAMEKFVGMMKKQREVVVRMLMWEIAKTRGDSEKEFDRTVDYIIATIEALKDADHQAAKFEVQGGVVAQVRRAPLGVTFCMGPFNYPLNETFATLIPALLVGNTVVAKLPRNGLLCQIPLFEAFAKCFPPGVINIFSGSGRELAKPIMESGLITCLAFIGSSSAARQLKQYHPKINRLRCALGLDAKNPAIILQDANVGQAVSQCLAGSLSFNGQRCTALKILFVHKSLADKFVSAFSSEVDKLNFGMPWEAKVSVTPLAEGTSKVTELKELLEDAEKKGAKVMNQNGGITNGSFFFPAVVYPVKSDMKVWSIEQFGPIVPIVPFSDIQEVYDYMTKSQYGQQCSVFGQDSKALGPIIDVLVNLVCRVNLNSQCQRGPDVLPFTGRNDSAENTLSITDALKAFSIETMVASSVGDAKTILSDVIKARTSKFLNRDFLF